MTIHVELMKIIRDNVPLSSLPVYDEAKCTSRVLLVDVMAVLRRVPYHQDNAPAVGRETLHSLLMRLFGDTIKNAASKHLSRIVFVSDEPSLVKTFGRKTACHVQRAKHAAKMAKYPPSVNMGNDGNLYETNEAGEPLLVDGIPGFYTHKLLHSRCKGTLIDLMYERFQSMAITWVRDSGCADLEVSFYQRPNEYLVVTSKELEHRRYDRPVYAGEADQMIRVYTDHLPMKGRMFDVIIDSVDADLVINHVPWVWKRIVTYSSIAAIDPVVYLCQTQSITGNVYVLKKIPGQAAQYYNVFDILRWAYWKCGISAEILVALPILLGTDYVPKQWVTPYVGVSTICAKLLQNRASIPSQPVDDNKQPVQLPIHTRLSMDNNTRVANVLRWLQAGMPSEPAQERVTDLLTECGAGAKSQVQLTQSQKEKITDNWVLWYHNIGELQNKNN